MELERGAVAERRVSRRPLLAWGSLAVVGALSGTAGAPVARANGRSSDIGRQLSREAPGAPATTAAVAAGPAPIARSRRAGTFQAWFSANWNRVTDEAVGQVFVDWGKG